MSPVRKSDDLSEIVRKTRKSLQSLQDFQVQALPMSARVKFLQESKEKLIEPIRTQALVCQKCRLAKTRKSVVFGEGSLEAPVVFVGEGPGQEEDLQGRPFVGMAGNLLTKIIQAMGFQREQVYIANVVKCRPPMNRVPELDEVESCHPYLAKQLEIIQPKVICTLGKTAAQALLGMEVPISRVRGQVFHWKNIPVVVTYHPAYLLRNPSAKTLVWQDMKKALEILGSDGPPPVR